MNFLTLLFPILDKIIPDPKAKAAAQLEILKLQQEGEFREADNALKAAQGQLEVNKVEAASGSGFVAGWRPLVGYVCAVGLAYQFVLHPLLCWFAAWKGVPIPPRLDMDTLITILTGMLGLAGLRTGEKMKGVAR